MPPGWSTSEPTAEGPEGRMQRVIRIMDIDGKVNPADALTKHLDKPTWLGYISRMYNRDMSTVPTSIAQPRSSKGGV